MPETLKTLVLETIHSIYPSLEEDIISLSGSRALGVGQSTSDIDIMVFTTTDKYQYYKAISVEKGFRTEDEDPGFEKNIYYEGNEIVLEVKFITELYFSNLIDYHALLNTICLNQDTNKDTQLKNEMRKWFDKNYEKHLMKGYIQFFQDFKDMKGLFEKTPTSIRDQSIFIKKGAVLESFLRLIYLIQKQGYPTVKRLITLLTGELGEWAHSIVARIIALESYENLLVLEKEIKEQINGKHMPERKYVGARRKFLKEFKQK